jgi:hypothetical protein
MTVNEVPMVDTDNIPYEAGMGGLEEPPTIAEMILVFGSFAVVATGLAVKATKAIRRVI